MNKKDRKLYLLWLTTFSKKAVATILIVSGIDLQLSYVLAFMGREQIAESLSSTIVSAVVPVTLGYLFKALFETFFEEREKRLRKDFNEEVENEREY